MAWHRVSADDPLMRASSDLAVATAHLRDAVVLPEAQHHRDLVLGFVADHHDAALRTNLRGHLTGSALVVDGAAERTLLMLHRKLGRWFQPGGHADGDTSLPAVAWREATEETGINGLTVLVPAIDVDVHEVAPPGEIPHLHLDVRYLVIAPVGARPQANEESRALRWVSEAELDGLEPAVDESTRRLVRRGMGIARELLSEP
jgi:8-oxo-dGTP pyrophosphatase MutT (NUDIX family)